MRIALIGSAPSSVSLAPIKDQKFDAFTEGRQHDYPMSPVIDQDWEIWGCSPGAFGVLPRFTRFFEVHRWEPGKPWFSPEYVEFLRNFRGPVYTGGPVPEVTNHVVYPIARVEEEFSPYFLTSSLALMLALAILTIEDARNTEGHDPDGDVIGMWGVDMAATEEYGYQRAGCQHFVLEAFRRGIGVYLPPESDLLRPIPVYGISEWDHNYIKLTARMRELNNRLTDRRKNLESAQSDIAFCAGAMDDLTYMVNTWTSPYGLPSGVILRQKPGSGLGGGVTHVDGSPSAPSNQVPVDGIKG